MPDYTIDLDTTEGKSFETPPAGTYDVMLMDFEADKDSGSIVFTGDKSKYIRSVFQIINGEYKDQKIWRNYPITGKGTGFFTEFWELATGEKLPVGEEDGAVMNDLDLSEAIGTQFTAVCTIREWDGNEYLEIKKLLPLR